MGFVKRGDVEILEIITGGEAPDDEKTKKALEEARKATKNIGIDGNNSEFNTESD